MRTITLFGFLFVAKAINPEVFENAEIIIFVFMVLGIIQDLIEIIHYLKNK